MFHRLKLFEIALATGHHERRAQIAVDNSKIVALSTRADTPERWRRPCVTDPAGLV